MTLKEYFKAIVLGMGFIFFLGWIFYGFCFVLYIGSASDSTGDFMPEWEWINFEHPFVMITGIACIIFMIIQVIKMEKLGKI